MKQKKPINLNFFTIGFPLTAVASILHRLSGVLVFLFIPLLLWLLNTSLISPSGFEKLQLLLSLPFIKLILWVFLVALLHHLLAGIRHTVMDMGIGEGLKNARLSAKIVMGLTIILAILIAIWLW